MACPAFVGAEHAFHDAGLAASWAECLTPTASRLRLFDEVAQQLRGSRRPAAGRLPGAP
jgi:hypothetical protein